MPHEQGNTDYPAFLDECGDHSLTKIDPDFPLFVLSLILVKRKDYLSTILPTLNGLKLRYWDHEGVNLHGRDIRMKTGPFAFLNDMTRRDEFMSEISSIMRRLPYTLFVVGIHKDKLCKQYSDAKNPYDLALTFVMERLFYWMRDHGQASLPITAESRGRNEDNDLKATLFDVITKGTGHLSPEKLQRYCFPMLFHDKRKNIAGIQLADLCAHPSARHILIPEQPNQAFEAIKPHIYSANGHDYGWKVFP
jgi:hypothetical protein